MWNCPKGLVDNYVINSKTLDGLVYRLVRDGVVLNGTNGKLSYQNGIASLTANNDEQPTELTFNAPSDKKFVEIKFNYSYSSQVQVESIYKGDDNNWNSSTWSNSDGAKSVTIKNLDDQYPLCITGIESIVFTFVDEVDTEQ